MNLGNAKKSRRLTRRRLFRLSRRGRKSPVKIALIAVATLLIVAYAGYTGWRFMYASDEQQRAETRSVEASPAPVPPPRLTLREILFAYTYDTQTFCRRIYLVSPDASHFANCFQQERQADRNINRMAIPSKVKKHCYEVGQSSGGSYQAMETCVKKNIKAYKLD